MATQREVKGRDRGVREIEGKGDTVWRSNQTGARGLGGAHGGMQAQEKVRSLWHGEGRWRGWSGVRAWAKKVGQGDLQSEKGRQFSHNPRGKVSMFWQQKSKMVTIWERKPTIQGTEHGRGA